MNHIDFGDAMTENEFFEKYNPLSERVTREQAQSYDVHRVWTIVECDGVMAGMPGFHHVNRTGEYMITNVAWKTGLEEVILHCGCDVDGDDCQMCIPV